MTCPPLSLQCALPIYREGGGRLVVGQAQLPRHPVALDAVVVALRHHDEVAGYPASGRLDALADEGLGQVLAGLRDVGERTDLLGRARPGDRKSTRLNSSH